MPLIFSNQNLKFKLDYLLGYITGISIDFPFCRFNLFSFKILIQANSLFSFLQILFIWKSVKDSDFSPSIAKANKNKNKFSANFINSGKLSIFCLKDYHLLYKSIISFNSSLLKSVEIKTSWAVFPLLAIALYPFIVFTDNLIINLDDLPLDLEIAAGVIVLIFISCANFWSIGIRPSILVL